MLVSIPMNRERSVRLAPHRFGQRGNMLIVEGDGHRVEVYLSDQQLERLVAAGVARLNAKRAVAS